MTSAVAEEKKPIRIAHIYDSQCGRNDGAPLYTLEALRKKEGVRAYHYLPKGDPKIWGKYDLYWVVDFADDALGYSDYKFPTPYFYWCSDYHISPESYSHRLKRAKEADWIGCYQKGNVIDFIRDGIPESKIFWLPPAVEPSAYRPGWFDAEKGWLDCDVQKKYDIGFVGHVNNEKRIDFLDHMFRAFPNFFYGNRLFEFASNIYNECRIVVNSAHRDDINMRVFEAMGSGAFLLTEKVPYLDEIFTDGVHLVTYSSFDEAVEKAKYYLSHDEERKKIASAGFDEIVSKHTYRHRIDDVLRRIYD